MRSPVVVMQSFRRYSHTRPKNFRMITQVGGWWIITSLWLERWLSSCLRHTETSECGRLVVTLVFLARKLYLEPILGSMDNVTKALSIIEVVENTRFDTLSERWRFRGDYDTGSVCRVGPGADYLY